MIIKIKHALLFMYYFSLSFRQGSIVAHKQLKTQWPAKLKSWPLILFITIWAKGRLHKTTTMSYGKKLSTFLTAISHRGLKIDFFFHLSCQFTFPNFYLDFFSVSTWTFISLLFPFSIWFLCSFSIWNFISLSYLEVYFSFLFGLLFSFSI